MNEELNTAAAASRSNSDVAIETCIDAETTPLENPGPKKMSKKKQKKMAKMARYLENRKQMRRIEKARRKENRAKKKAAGELAPKPLKKTMASSVCKIRVAVDMAYEDVSF